MRVKRIFVESFGDLSGETLDFSQGNLRLVYGRNEAGKSTLLNFIRDVLFGLPDGKDRSGLFGESVVGGTLEFELQDGRSGKVLQKWSRVGKSRDEFLASVRNSRLGVDDVLDREAFRTLLGGADRTLFARYFGFAYQDLVDGNALLDKTGLTRLVYGMILGSPDQLESTQKALLDRCNALFRPTGKNQRINAALKKLKDAKSALGSAELGTSVYRKKSEERELNASKLAESRASCDKARENFRYWKTLDDARDVFERYCEGQGAYDAFCAQTRFDPETLSRFDETQEKEIARLTERRDAVSDDLPRLESEANAKAESVRRLEASRSSIVEHAPRITDLSKRVELMVKTRDGLPKLKSDLEREKNALRVGLQTLGFLPFDATDATFDETVKLRRAPILDDVFSEIDELATTETRLDAKISELEGKKRSAQDELEQRTQGEKDERRKLTENFGEEGRDEDVKELEALVENFVGLKMGVKELAAKKRSIDASRSTNDAKLKELVVQVCGADVDGATILEVAKLLCEENVAAPLESEIAEIQAKDAALTSQLDDSQKESARFEKDIARLESEIQRLPQDVVSFDMISERRDERSRLWDSFKSDLTSGKIFDPSTLETLERLTREIDDLSDRRYKSAEHSGKLEERRRTRDELAAQKDKVDKETSRLQTARETLQNDVRKRWRRVGLERCSALPISAAQGWLAAWKLWREKRATLRQDEESLNEETSAVVERLRAAFEIASRWVESNEAPSAFESLDKAVLGAEKTLEKAKARLATYREIVGNVRAQQKERVDATQRIAAYVRELAQTNEERKELNARLDGFCRRYGYEYDAEAKAPCVRLSATLQKLREWQERFGRYDEEYDKFLGDQGSVKEYEASVDELRNEFQETSERKRPEDCVADWESRLTEAQGVENKLKNEKKSYDDKLGELKSKRQEKNGYDEKLRESAENLSVPFEDFASFRRDAKTNRELKERFEQESNFLRAKLGVKSDEEFKIRLDELAKYDPETVKKNSEDYAREVKRNEEERDVSSAKLGEFDGELKKMENEGNPASLLSRYQEALSELREAVDVYAPTFFARRSLEETLQICKEEKIPEILRYARELFKDVTGGRYEEIEEIESTVKSGRGSRSEKEGFRVLERGSGALKTPEQLSSGTREQLYLALRLAHVRQYCQQAEPLPIWADDVLLSASCDRVGKLIEALKRFADEGYQVVLSTCQASTRRAFEKIVGEEFVTTLKSRKFK